MFAMGPLNVACAAEATTAMPPPSPTLTNPEMILPFAGVDASPSRSPSPEVMFPLLLPDPMAPAALRHDSKQMQSPVCVERQQSSPHLSHSPGESSVNSDEFGEGITWLRFDDDIETGSDAEDDEERFGSFPQVADSDDVERWDMPQSGPMDEEDFSSAALSRRADIILANAKKRLSVCVRPSRDFVVLANKPSLWRATCAVPDHLLSLPPAASLLCAHLFMVMDGRSSTLR